MSQKKIILVGGITGICAGITDSIPMIIQNLTWDAIVSAFSMWIIVGIFIASINWKINSMLKGIIISFMILTPCAFIIGKKEPFSLIPIAINTLILGLLSGLIIKKFIPNN